MNRLGANLAFSLCAGLGSLAVAIASAAKGRWAVAVVFGLLAVGFALRGSEGYRRRRRQRSDRRAG